MKDSSPRSLSWQGAEPEPRQPEPGAHSQPWTPSFDKEGLNGLEEGVSADALRGH